MKLEEIKTITKKEIISDVEAIEVVREYILEKTGKFIDSIVRPRGQIFIKGNLEIMTDFELLTKMYAVAKAHYLTK